MDNWLTNAMRSINLYETTNTFVYNWSRQDCYNWAASECQKLGLPLDHATLEPFLSYTGEELVKFSMTEFVQKLDRNYGETLYDSFQKLLRSQGIEPNNNINDDSTLYLPDSCYDLLADISRPEDTYLDSLLDGVGQGMTPLRPSSPVDDNLTFEDLGAEVYANLQPMSSSTGLYGEDGSLGADFNYLSISSPTFPSPSPSLSSSSSPHYSLPPHGSSPFHTPDASTPHILREEGAFALPECEEDWADYLPCDAPAQPTEPCTPTPTRTRRRSSLTQPTESRDQQRGPLAPLQTPSRKRSRGPKSWEYIMRLLASPEYNPSLLQWVDKNDGTFKFNKPADIARMWGQRSRKQNLSYDNFARGLRYHYKTGALKPVSERQLVYRCGKKALAFLTKLQLTNDMRF